MNDLQSCCCLCCCCFLCSVVYSEKIFVNALEELDTDNIVNEDGRNNQRFASETVFFADSVEGLQLQVSG